MPPIAEVIAPFSRFPGWLLRLACIIAIVCSSPAWCSNRYANGFDLQGALVPQDDIVNGGPPRDGIPALIAPRFVAASEATYLRPDDRVLGVLLNGVAKAYPERILLWHEIVNDEFDGEPLVVSFCPLCGTGAAHSASVDGKRLTFGVSGLLYNSNLLLYDKQTQSLWSQMLGKAIAGPFKGTALKDFPITHTTWQAWRKEHPRTVVLSERTGYRRDYGFNPYSDYLTNALVMFRVSQESHRFHPKEWVLGVEADGTYKAYPFTELAKAGNVVRDRVGGRLIEVRLDAATWSASASSDGKPYPSQTAYWFAWFAFHPRTDAYQAPPATRR
ncbi:DUF3179 domain-containing protein [Cupriavidus sp. TMH.W2]|uniref:DUF3179 domain-containing protein n=1 Tax=Cupriavidus sp. TMH.W2 TaxID=3434465 RepID=UPI003D76A945